MLKEKITNGSDGLPPELPGVAPERVRIATQSAANEGTLRRTRNHARRMRRHGRAARAHLRQNRGWAIRLW